MSEALLQTDTTSALEKLVISLREVIGRELPAAETSDLVAVALDPFLTGEELLTDEQQTGDPDNYKQHVVHVEDDGSFSIVSLVWLPGQKTSIHDHVSWCVVGVYQGEEAEIQYKLVVDGNEKYLVPTGTAVNTQHSTCGFAPPGDIHEVNNSGDTKAISIHVYGADISRLGTSIRRQYPLPIRNDVS